MSMSKAHKTAKLTTKLGYTGLGWLGGLFAASFMGTVPSICVLAAATCVSAAFLLRGAKYSRFVLLVSAAALTGAIYLAGYGHFTAERLRGLSGSEVTIEGVVTDIVQVIGRRDRLTVKGRLDNGMRAKVTVYSYECDADVGDRVRADFTAAVPENTPVYDGEDRAASQGIFLQSERTAQVTRLGAGSYPLRLITRLRRYTSANIRRRCGGQAGAFIVSILCADGSYLTAETENAVYRSGLGHIFAVSGTHVVILSAFIMRLLEVLLRPKRLRSAVMIAVLAAFAVFAGCSPSVVRACILSGFGYLAVFFNRRGSSPNSLGGAAVIITLACPYAAFSASFLLSFSSAAAVNVLLPALTDREADPPLKKSIAASLCIFLLNFPFAAHFFSEIPLFFAAANLLLLPLCTACLCCAFAFMLSGCLLTPLIYAAELTAGAVIRVCGIISALPFTYAGTFYRSRLVLLGAAGVILLVLTALFGRERRSRASVCVTAALIVCASASVLTLVRPADCLTVVPTARGYTAELYTDGRLMVFDMGSGGSGSYHAARTAERLHTGEVCLFTLRNTSHTRIRYLRYMPELKAVFSADGKTGISAAGGAVIAGDASVTFGGEYVVRLRGHTLRLGKDSLTIDGEEYAADGFLDISTVTLS